MAKNSKKLPPGWGKYRRHLLCGLKYPATIPACPTCFPQYKYLVITAKEGQNRGNKEKKGSGH